MSITSDRIRENGFIHPLADDAADEIEALESERDALRARLELVEKDAERYRWMRDDAFKHSDDCFFEAGQLFAGHQGDSFDVAIDQAMEQGKQ